jgi:hypothetical protein
MPDSIRGSDVLNPDGQKTGAYQSGVTGQCVIARACLGGTGRP